MEARSGTAGRPATLARQDFEFLVGTHGERVLHGFQQRGVGMVVAVGEASGHGEHVTAVGQGLDLFRCLHVAPVQARDVPDAAALELELGGDQFVLGKEILEVLQVERRRRRDHHDPVAQGVVHPGALEHFGQATLGQELAAELADQILEGIGRFAVGGAHVGAFHPDGGFAQETHERGEPDPQRHHPEFATPRVPPLPVQHGVGEDESVVEIEYGYRPCLRLVSRMGTI